MEAMKVKPRPILRYHGGKWMLAPWIISHFPEHRVYVEPFGGGASVLLRKERAYAEVYNDLDSEIVNLFRVLRERWDDLIENIYLTPYAREEYEDARNECDDPFERARKTVIKSFMGFGSTAIHKPSGFRSDSNRSGTTPAHDWANYPEPLMRSVDRLRGVVIENRDACEVMKKFDSPDTLHYLDPPYVRETRTASSHYGRDEVNHEAIASVARSLVGKVIISGYAHESYDRLYAGWRRVEKNTYADGARKRVEVLWLNF